MSWRQEIVAAEKDVVKAQAKVQVAQRALALLKELAKLSDGGQVTLTSTKKKKKSKVKAETETEAPVKRGRGRPPKQKSDDSTPKRGRGRPKKDKTVVVPSETEGSPEAPVSDKKSLGELCLEIAREASEPKPIGYFIEELHKKNYSSKAKDFKNIVYQGLNHLKNEGHLNKTEELEYFLVDSK